MAAYATRDDLVALGIAAQALDGIDTDTQDAALEYASRMADGYLRSRFQLPIVAPYPADLVGTVCAIAAWNLLKTRGFDPENPGDAALKEDRREAIKWLEAVRDNKIDPSIVDSQSGGTMEAQDGPFVLTLDSDGSVVPPTPRGW